jgi:hypothetical protein
MSTNGAKGGARAGAGGTVTRITLSREHAKALRAILKLRPGGAYSQEEVTRWVEARIDEACEALDAELRRNEEQAWEGEVL